MKINKDTSKLLGIAFLVQAIASLVWTSLLSSLIEPGNITTSMTNISNNILQVRISILLAMVTSMGIVALGVLLFLTLRKQNMKIALIALGFYIIEAVILAVSRIQAFSLLQISQESAITGHPENLLVLGNIFHKSAEFGDWLHMLFFALGATLFYYLFLKSKYIPKALAIFGLTASSLALIGTPLALLGHDVPMIVFLPNLPFELGIGVWLIVKGFNPSAIAPVSAKPKKAK